MVFFSDSPRKRKFFIGGAILVLILAVVAGIGTCTQCRAGKSDGSMVRTPADVSDFSVVFVDGDAILYWADSTDALLDHIEISWHPEDSAGGETVKVAKGTGKYVLPGLEEGVVYNFTVTAVDKWNNKSAGKTGGSGKAFRQRRAADTPPAETPGISGIPLVGQATLSWTNLDDSEYDHIEIYYDPDHEKLIRVPKGVGSKTLTGLANGIEHTFYAVAVDAQGNRKPLTELGLFISDHVTAPESVSGRPSTGEFTIVWTDPPDPQLEHFEIAYAATDSGDGTPSVGTLFSVAKGVQSQIFTELSPTTRYEFTVYAVDSARRRRPVTGAQLSPIDTSFSDADLTAIVKGYPVDGQIRLDWTDPVLAGLDYIELITNPGTNARLMTVARGMQNSTFIGLSDNEEYAFLLYGVDKDGNRQVIRGVRLSTPARTLGGDEMSAVVRGKPVTGQITLDWRNPSYTGFDHVEIVTNPDGNAQPITLSRDMQTNTFNGLSDDEEYSFLVYGIDSNGNRRVIRDVNLSTPQLPDISAKPFIREVTLVWQDPDDPNLAYIELTYSPDGEISVSVEQGIETFTFSGLSDDTEYEFFVTAVTTEGNRYAMAAEAVVPDLPVLIGTPKGGTALLEWIDPVSINIDHMEIVYAPTNGSENEKLRFAIRGAESTDIPELIDGEEYAFIVYAVDNAGARHPVRSAFRAVDEEELDAQEWGEMRLTSNLRPLNWRVTNNTTFGSGNNSTIYALSFGYTESETALWIAGGDEGKMAYSRDYGLSWTQIPNNTFGSFGIQAITYANGRWMAGGRGGRLAWSTDAVNWNAISATYFINNDINVNVIVYENDRWMVGGSNGAIMFSEDDGRTWTVLTTNVSEQSEITALAFNNGRWVAGTTLGVIIYSDNGGRTWTTARNNIFGNSAVNVLIHDKGRWLAAGYSQRAAWSEDGITWQPIARPFYILRLGYNGFRWVAGGQEGRLAWTGSSGDEWVVDTLGRGLFGSGWIHAIGFGRSPTNRGRWLAAGQNGKAIYADEE